MIVPFIGRDEPVVRRSGPTVGVRCLLRRHLRSRCSRSIASVSRLAIRKEISTKLVPSFESRKSNCFCGIRLQCATGTGAARTAIQANARRYQSSIRLQAMTDSGPRGSIAIAEVGAWRTFWPI
jgi:hypothetical protein